MKKRLTAQTLGMYLETECSYHYGSEWHRRTEHITGATINDFTFSSDFTLILRPLESVTDQEWTEWSEEAGESLKADAECGAMTAYQVDYLRGKGIDLGGWIEVPTHKGRVGNIGETIIIQWATSLIAEGLAIEKGATE